MGKLFSRRRPAPTKAEIERMQEELNKRWQAEIQSKEFADIIYYRNGKRPAKRSNKQTKKG